MIKILFICHGNICRSPIAEFYMKDLVQREGRADQFEIESAATTDEEIWGDVGNPVYPPARKILKEHGIDCSGKRARLIQSSDYEHFDLLIGMDRENITDMRSLWYPDPQKKLSLLLDWTDHPGNVADPWYTGDFRATWRDVSAGCQGLLKALIRSGKVEKGRG